MKFQFLILSALSVSLLSGCAHSHRGGHGNVHVGANEGGKYRISGIYQ